MEKWNDIVKHLHQHHKNDIHLGKKPSTIGLTRWSGKYVTLNGAMKNPTSFIAMFECLHCMCTMTELKPQKAETQQKLNDTLEYWCEYENIIRAYILNDILTVLDKSTKRLQKTALFIYDVVIEIC